MCMLQFVSHTKFLSRSASASARTKLILYDIVSGMEITDFYFNLLVFKKKKNF